MHCKEAFICKSVYIDTHIKTSVLLQVTVRHNFDYGHCSEVFHSGGGREWTNQ